MASLGVQRTYSSVPSSSVTPPCRYEVFLNFRGKDTRDNFVSHLHAALNLKGIRVFKDDERLKKGKSISPELLRAIEESRYSIVVISKNYGSSRWCLDELVKILECKNEKMQTVYPVFYHVDPSEVRKQTGNFGKEFSKVAGKNDEEKVEKWKKALEEVGNFAGWPYPSPTASCESNLINQLVRRILFELLNHTYSSVCESLVGMESHMERMMELLDLDVSDARVIGLWGMGGIGKTTIARVVYNFIFHQFEGHSFLENVREVHEKSGLIELQRQLISNILSENEVKVGDSWTAKSMIKDRVHCKKILIVLDDVDDSIELEELIGKQQWFCPGSRIIITTRNKHMLIGYGVTDQDIYEVKELDQKNAIKLLSWNAFNEDQNIRGFEELLDCAVECAGHIPLSLKVLGSFLRGRTQDQWKSALRKLKGSPDHRVLRVLNVSYNSLDSQQQEIFKDIACFLKGEDKDCAEKILESYGLSPRIDLEVLIERSLITLEGNSIWMHELIQQLGWDIVLKESDDPGRRSRLWLYNDVHRVLTENSGTSSVKSMILSPGQKPLQLRRKAFKRLKNIRLLRINNVLLPRGLKYLPNELRYLSWSGYPLERFPVKFQLGHLVQLIMGDSDIEQLWEGTMELPNLRIMSLAGSRKLKKCPDFTKVPSLVELNFAYCIHLENVHSSIGGLKKLSLLNLGDTSVRSLPTGMQLESLWMLILRNCKKLASVPENLGNMERLLEIILDSSGVTNFETSSVNLPHLDRLSMADCENLETLPTAITQLEPVEELYLSGCINLKNIPDTMDKMTSLIALRLERCRALRRLPNSICQTKALKYVYLEDCTELDRLPENLGDMESLECLVVSGTSIRELPSSTVNLQKLKILKMDRCKEVTFNSLRSFFSNVLGTSSTEHTPLSRSLTRLSLSYCNLRSIPQEICCFKSLELLCLEGNDFEHLPVTMKKLSKLLLLSVSDCRRLEQLPELSVSLRCLNANDCLSLRTLWSVSVYQKIDTFLFRNCLKLLENNNFPIDIILSSQFQGNYALQETGFLIIYPGDVIPKWFNHTTGGYGASSSFQLPQNWFNKFLGFVICVVLENHNEEEAKGLKRIEIFLGNCYYDSVMFPALGCIEDSTVFIAYDKRPLDNLPYADQIRKDGVELTMKFVHVVKVKRCAVRVIYMDDQTLGNAEGEGGPVICAKKSRRFY